MKIEGKQIVEFVTSNWENTDLMKIFFSGLFVLTNKKEFNKQITSLIESSALHDWARAKVKSAYKEVTGSSFKKEK